MIWKDNLENEEKGWRKRRKLSTIITSTSTIPTNTSDALTDTNTHSAVLVIISTRHGTALGI